MKRLLTLGVCGLATTLTAGAYAAETPHPSPLTTLSIQSTSVPQFLKAFFGEYKKGPYDIDASVVKAHANDTVMLRFASLPQDELDQKVFSILREQYGVAVTQTDGVYKARMAE
jgi:hypothetical protein